MSIFELFASSAIAKGFSSLFKYIKDSRIDIRAVNKTAFRFSGVVPGGEEAINEYLKNWTESADFEKLIEDLSEGKSFETAFSNALDSFLKATPIQRRDIAEKVLNHLIQTIRDELYNSSEGNALQMRRIEQINTDTKFHFDEKFEELRGQLPQLSTKVREAINKYLKDTDEGNSLKNLLKSGKINKAQAVLEDRIDKLEKLLDEYPEAKTILQDQKLDLLFKISAVLSQKGNFSGAQKYYYQAKELGFTKPDHIKQALNILFNLTKIEEYETLFLEHKKELQDHLSAEVDLAVLKGEWDKVNELIPKDIGKFRHLHLSIIAELETASDSEISKKAVEIFSMLQQAAELLDNHPLHKVQLSTTTVAFINRIVEQMLDTPGLDREALIKFAKHNIEKAIQACEKVNFERASYIILNHAYKLYALLQEDDKLKEIEHTIRNFETNTDSKKYRDIVLHEEHVSQARQLYFDAVDLINNPTGVHFDKAKRFLQTALDLADHEVIKFIIAQTYINFLIQEDDSESAREVLSDLTDIPRHKKILLEIPVLNKEKGTSDTLEYIKDAINNYPFSIEFHRRLIELLIKNINEKKNADAPSEVLNSLLKNVQVYVAKLDKLLPSVANQILLARAYIANHEYSTAISLLRKIDQASNVYVQAGHILAECLIKLERIEEAATQLVELAEITNDPSFATYAANYLLEAQKFEDAISFLEPWVEKYQENPFLNANLALAIIVVHPGDPDKGRKAFNILLKACRIRPDLKLINFWLAKAATIAGKPEVSQRYTRRQLRELPTLPIRDKEDFDSLGEVSDEGLTLINLDRQTGIKAFVEWQHEFKESINKLYQLNMISYSDIFSKNGRPWEQWLSWTQISKEQFKEHSKSEVVKAALPYIKREEVNNKKLLLDLTALLTLCALDSTEIIAKALHDDGWKLHIRSSDLHRLRLAVSSPEYLLFDTVELPYNELINELRNHDLIVPYSTEDVEKFSELVIEPLQGELGNSHYDFGLIQSLENGVYVSDDHDTLHLKEKTHGQGIISSKALLRTLIEEGVIGENEARKAEETDERFKNWQEAEKVQMPENVVISAFSLPYWFKAGLLTSDNKGWLRREPEWPKLHIGPFCRVHIIDQAQENQSKNLKSKFASRQYTVLGQLISDNIIEVLPDKSHSNKKGKGIRLYEVTPNAIDLINLANHHDLHIWGDDRALAFLLWPYGHPLRIPELAKEVHQIKQVYPSIELYTTEELLEELYRKELIDHRKVETLGYTLVKMGYRPLSFRLAFSYLLRNFVYVSGSTRYQPVLRAIEGIVSSPDSYTAVDNLSFSLDLKPQQRFFLGTILPDLFSHIWFVNVARSIEERKKLADDLLESMTKYIGHHKQDMPDKMANFWVGILHSSTNYIQENLSKLNDSDEDEKAEFFNRFQESLNWYATSLKKYEKGAQLKRVVLENEDRIIDLISSMSEDRVQENFQRFGEQRKDISIDDFRTLSTVAIVRFLQPFLSPFLHTDLINEFNPLLRRAIGILTRYDSGLKVAEVYTISKDVEEFNIKVEEEEIEVFAIDVIKKALQGNPNYQQTIRRDLTLYCIWHRPLPADEKELINKGYERHDVTIDISLLRLLLRDELHQIPALIDVILNQLHLFDPLLGQKLANLKSGLVHADSEVRNQAREQLAVGIINSIYFELHRDFTHCIERLHKLSVANLEVFLTPNTEWLEPELNNLHIVKLAEREYPHAMLNSIFFLSSNSEKLYETGHKMVDSLVKSTSEDNNLPDPFILMRQALEIKRSPYDMAWSLHQFLILISKEKEVNTITYQEEEWKPNEWLKQYLSQALAKNEQKTEEDDGLKSRSESLKTAHACILRLATYAVCSPNHMNRWKKELKEDDKVMQNCLHGIMAFTERLFPFLVAKYDTELEEMVRVTEDAVHSLNLAYDEPGYFPDQFNPFLIAPHLFDHEVAALFHTLISFIEHDENPELVIDLEWLLGIVEPWSNSKHIKAQEIYDQQKEKNSNELNLQMILSPYEAANKLLSIIKKMV